MNGSISGSVERKKGHLGIETLLLHWRSQATLCGVEKMKGHLGIETLRCYTWSL